MPLEVTAYHVDDSESPPVVVPVKATVWENGVAKLARRLAAHGWEEYVAASSLHGTPKAAIDAWRSELMRRAMAYEDLAAELHRKASTEPRQ